MFGSLKCSAIINFLANMKSFRFHYNNSNNNNKVILALMMAKFNEYFVFARHCSKQLTQSSRQIC